MGNERRTEVKDGVLIVGDAPGGNYREKAVQQARQLIGAKPGLYHQYIAHDDWCAIWSVGKCNCDPDIVTRMASGDDAARPGRE